MIHTQCDAGHELRLDVSPGVAGNGLTVTCLSPTCPMSGFPQFRSPAQLQSSEPNPLLWSALGAVAGGLIAGPRGALIGGTLGLGAATAKKHGAALRQQPEPGVL